jgi:transcriptional regulator with XRE-family HTH domain
MRVDVEKIRQIAKSYGWSQGEFAERAGLSQSYLCSLLKGKREMTLRALNPIVNALNIKASDVILEDLTKDNISDELLNLLEKHKVNLSQLEQLLIFGDMINGFDFNATETSKLADMASILKRRRN